MAEFALYLPEGQGLMASVDDDGILAFAVLAGPGSPIRGTEMFDLMMRAFGARVTVIEGTWRRASEGRTSTNLDKINSLTAAGIPLANAVRAAWTVTRAARWGFTEVSVMPNLEGRPGAYTKIDVRIEKPGATL